MPTDRGCLRWGRLLLLFVAQPGLRHAQEVVLGDDFAEVSSWKKGDTSRRQLWLQKVVDRYDAQEQNPTVTAEVHALRIGDIAIITNPFELFLDCGVQIQGRSKAQNWRTGLSNLPLDRSSWFSTGSSEHMPGTAGRTAHAGRHFRDEGGSYELIRKEFTGRSIE